MLSINNTEVKNLPHSEVVQLLKECQSTTIKILRMSKKGSKTRENREHKKKKLNIFEKSRSKTPTADFCSSQPKMVLPVRSKTPLVDTRTRIQTPLLGEDTEDEEVGMHANGGRLRQTKHDFSSFVNALGDADSYSTGLNFDYKSKPVNFNTTDDRLPEDCIYSSTSASYYNHPVAEPNFCDYQNLNLSVDHDKFCPCYVCKDINKDFSYSQYSLPPQMSESVGQKLSEYLIERKRMGPNMKSHQEHEIDALERTTKRDENYFITEVTLVRQATGFGFRVVGGTEEGSHVSIGHIVPGGSASMSNCQTNDEILMINGEPVENASHHKVVQMIGEAGLRGQVTLLLRRRLLKTYPYDLLVSRPENEGFGFVIISAYLQAKGSFIGN